MKKLIVCVALLLFLVPAVLAGASDPSSPEAYWEIDLDDGGTWADSLDGHDLSETGNVNQNDTVFFKVASASFPGTNGNHLVNSDAVWDADESVSAVCWVYAEVFQASGLDQVINNRGTDGWQLSLQSGGKLEFYVQDNSCFITNAGAMRTSTWYMVAFALNDTAGNVDIWVNTSLVGSDTGCDYSGNPSSEGVWIGERSDGYGDFNGNIDNCMVYQGEVLDQSDIESIFAAGGPPAASATVSIESPVNDSIGNDNPLPVVFNSTASCVYAELYNGTTLLLNSSGVPADTSYQFNYTIVTGSYEFTVACVNSSSVSSSVTYYIHDETEPAITMTWPAADNSTVVVNGTAQVFNVTLADANLDSFNISVWQPNGSLVWNNVTYNISVTSYVFTRSFTPDWNGDWSWRVVAGDGHNALVSAAQRDRVASYTTQDTPSGKVLVTPENRITVESSVPIDLAYDDYAWHQVVDAREKKAGDTVHVDVYSQQPFRRRYSSHAGHLITGNNFVDFDGLASSVALTWLSPYHVRASFVLESPGVLTARTIGEVNENEVSGTFESNAAPVLDFVYNQTRDGDWSVEVNASDADGDVLVYAVNSSLIDMVNTTGVMSGSPAWADNGTYAVLVNVTDGLSVDSQVFWYTINVSERPESSGFSFSRFSCPIDSTASSIFFVGILAVLTTVWIIGLVKSMPLLNFLIAFPLLWTVPWVVAPCFEFAHFIFIAMGVVSVLYGIIGLSFKPHL